MSHEDTLQAIYQEFASFGATRGVGMPMMDGPRFAKFAKDCKLVDKTNLTPTDVDLIFAKAKSKTERRITFEQFYTAVTMMADKKYPDQAGDAALDKLMGKITASQGPKSSGTVADSSGIYGKLTDTNLYTGTHKERFNTDGTGKGLDGRDRVAKGKGSSRGEVDLSGGDDEHSPPISDDEESNEHLAAEVAKLGVTPSKPKVSTTTTTTTSSSSSPAKPALSKSAASPVKKSPSSGSSGMSKSASSPSAKTAATKPASSASKSPTAKTSPSKPSIFDKLTDSSQYTGTHKNRFNSDGSGRGMAGRDSVRKGGVSGQDLSQMVKRS